MKTSTLLRILALTFTAAIAGCAAPPATGDDLGDPSDAPALSEETPGEETGTTDFADPPANDDDTTIASATPFDGTVDVPIDDAPDAPAEDAPEAATTGGPAKAASPSYVSHALAHPNQFFKRQVRHWKWNPTGPLTSGNCAPTSLAMAAKIFHKEPAGLTIQQSIVRVRNFMNKRSDSGGASQAQVRLGASRLGLHHRAMPEGDLDKELAKKHVVVLAGYPGLDGTSKASHYQAAFRAAGYWYTFDENHSIAVFGKTGSGKYVVGDPLSKIGVITLTASQMHDYWARWGGSGTAVWR